MNVQIILLAFVIVLASADVRPGPMGCTPKSDVNVCNRNSLQKYYYIGYHVKLNFFQAVEFCNYHNMRLATINSMKETDQVLEYLKSFAFAKERLWISGSDLGQEGKFVWLSTGMPLSYTNYQKSQPDNHDNKEDCLEINENGEWNDRPCDDLRYFLCEYYY